MWADSHQRLILATALQNCRLGSSLSSILSKNNTLNSFKLLERPTPEELCYRLPSPASFPVPSQQHHSGAAPWYFTALPGYCCYKFPSQMHHFGLVLSLPPSWLFVKTLHQELQPPGTGRRSHRALPLLLELPTTRREHSPSGLHDLQTFSLEPHFLVTFPPQHPCLTPEAWASRKENLFSFKFLTTLNAVVRAVLLKYYGSGASHLSCPLNSLDISKIHLHQVQHSCLSKPTQDVNKHVPVFTY